MAKNNREEGHYNTFSILAFVFAFIFFPVGFVLGIISLSQIKKTNEHGQGLAIAAIVISALSFVFLVLFFAFWIFILSFFSGGYDNLDLDSRCLDIEIVATEVVNTMPEVFDVTLSRPQKEDEYIMIDGVKLVFSNANNTDIYTYDNPGNIFEETVRVSIPEEVLKDPSEVSVIVYFLDEEGNKQVCSIARKFEFGL